MQVLQITTLRFVANWLEKNGRVPRVIRSDAGTENVIMRVLQRALRADHNDNISGRKAFLVGRSVASQRIERLMGSLKTSFTQFWKNRFQDFQDTRIINTSNPVHRECIRFCFMGIIQDQLDMFV